MSKYTKICSNHFEYGRPVETAPNPTLFLKGYDDDSKVGVKRKAPTSRKEPPARKKILRKEPVLEAKKSQPEEEQLQEIPSDPEHLPLSPFSASRVEEPTCSTFADVSLLSSETGTGNVDFDVSETQERKIAEEPLSISATPLHYEPITTASNPSSSNEHQVISCPRLSWKYVKKYPKIIKLYTGCPVAAAFDFTVNLVKPKHGKIQYFKGNEMETTKRYQFSPSKPLCQKKPGPKRQLGLANEFLLVLMSIRLDSPLEDLAFRFKISAGYASKFFTTITIFLARELKPLIYWPAPEQTLSYKHPHFSGDFNKFEGIGDSTEQWNQRSSNPKAQYQTYSIYKSHNTVKKLVICTKSGSISYISDAYAGSATDRFITEDNNIAARFTRGYSTLYDKGFNVQDLFLQCKVTARIPPFVRSERQLTPSEVAIGKRIARARIHTERVIGRLKEFRLLDHTLPLNLVDLIDHTLPLNLVDLVDEIWIIACAITNMQPPLVKN